jgi:hypothetical protein
MSKITSVFQLSGGVGGSTLAHHLAHIAYAQNPHRLLVNMALTDSGQLLAKLGYEHHDRYSLDVSSIFDNQTTIYSLSLDVGNEGDSPVGLLPTDDPLDWVLPIVPNPKYSVGWSSYEDEINWRIALLQMIIRHQSFDIVVDGGVLLPDRFTLHNYLFEASDTVLLLLATPSDVDIALNNIKLNLEVIRPILIGDEMARLRPDIERRFGTKRTLLMPRNDAIRSSLAQNLVLTPNRKTAGYIGMLREIVEGE